MILCNYSNTDEQLSWYSSKTLNQLLLDHNIDGIELFFHGRYDVPEDLIPYVHGVHLGYYPTWLDAYKENESNNKSEFFTSINEIKSNYKKEYALAKKMKAKYMVFHVGYVAMTDVFNEAFEYSDAWVLDETAKLVNAIFDETSDVMLLFENLWWPGLKLTNKEMVVSFMEKINYKNKGIMLDLSHLILTSGTINNIEESSEYILAMIENLGDAKAYIKGIHINDTKGHVYKQSKLFLKHIEEKNVWDYITNLDQHLPFKSQSINKILEVIDPEYKVIEVKSANKEIWEKSLEEQMRYLK